MASSPEKNHWEFHGPFRSLALEPEGRLAGESLTRRLLTDIRRKSRSAIGGTVASFDGEGLQ